MEQEFARDTEWSDFHGERHHLKCEWQYVMGPASEKRGCTAGTRDEGNEGNTVDDFKRIINSFIAERRVKGYDGKLPEANAFLTQDEVVAVRLYSGPAFEKINEFLRAISPMRGEFRVEAARIPSLTFSATVGHLCRAIRKLAAVVMPEEARKKLYRGVRGELPKAFWIPDAQQLICATE
jgi:hypothetical protein